MRTKLPILGACLVACLATAAGAGGECISGTISAQLSNNPNLPVGTYEYCVTLSWNVGSHALSHVSVFPGLQGCECKCETDVVTFPTPAGTATGPGDGPGTCTVDYFGEYVCGGDPSIPSSPGPAVKFEPDPNGCEPGLSGTGTFCFYTTLPPGSSTTLNDGLNVKHGTQNCFGPLTGTFPNCSQGCEVLGVESTSWTTVKKAYYR